ncbi:MAG: HK97 family phage prohead protease [Methanobrevibacter sp.]|nr:HK97 family phage prohead protease [Methanobrevibacter sp.]
MKEKLMKEIRLNECEVRAEDNEEGKMIIEGYPIVFDREAYIEGWDGGFYEKVDRKAFDNADMSDVCLKINHNDDFFICARTRNGSLTLTPDERGMFIHAELIDTTQNRDVYKMVQAGLLTEGSFAFTVEEQEVIEHGKWSDPDYEIHRTILKVGKLFDVAICTNGAYGNLTEIYARSYEALENVKHNSLEKEKHLAVLKLRNKNKMKLMEVKKWN